MDGARKVSRVLPAATRSQSRGAAFVNLLRTAWQEYERDRARYFAGAMVYFALQSLVPLLLLLMATVGLVLRYSDAAASVEGQVLGAIEAGFGAQLRTLIETLFAHLEQESLVATAAGLIGLVYTASMLFRHLRMSFRAIWKYDPPLVSGPVRVMLWTTIREYGLAFLMVLAGSLLLVLALALLSVTQWVGGLLISLPPFSRIPAWLLALPGSVLIVGITFGLLLRYLPPVRLQWRHVWLGTALCTVAWVVGAEIVVLFGALFNSDGPTALGTFGGLLVMLIWFDKVSQLLFYGAEVCKVVYARESGET